MKNTQKQAFVLTCLIFSPLFLFAVLGDPFKSEIKGDDRVTLVMSQFIAQGQTNQVGEANTPPAPEEDKPKERKKEHKKEQKKREIHKHARKSIKEKPQEELTKASAPAGGAQIDNNAPTQIGTLAFGKDDNPFLREIKKAIDEAARKTYPRQARKMRLSGEVLLEFVWLHNQTLDKVRIVKSSGHEILDSNVLKVIARAAKNFPQYEKSVRIQIPIVYNLKD
ncbi:hypothetical protein CQA38_02845 [Campylobacter sp. MIT 12-5580]|uniref:energy transducer TonB family protein n=1 Tax=Campylobacter sp. MIT 12-5580 TaxID=2040651 RepID=UPI0010F5565E|nr:energy transducer TonB [Campylobacter sp. MIT 12-5580]TKX29726.1 hypothetical protein CQA38_02845 [Campylobacter sp. MIT 12-5580]